MDRARKWIVWTPRVLSLLFVLLLALLSLDVFGAGLGFWQTVLGLFIHNIPTLVLLVVVLLSWQRPVIGGVAFVAAGVLYGVVLFVAISRSGFAWHYVWWFLQISGVAFLIGALFLVGWRK